MLFMLRDFVGLVAFLGVMGFFGGGGFGERGTQQEGGYDGQFQQFGEHPFINRQMGPTVNWC